MERLLIPNKIVYCKRRSIALIIKNNGDFIVRAPIKTSDRKINSFIQEKKDWIITKRNEMFKNKESAKLNLTTGENITNLGETLTIKQTSNKIAKIKNGVLILPNENTEKAFISLLKRTLKKYLEVRVTEISTQFNFNYEKISVSSAKTNWGSCGYKNTLNFTYKLSLCPLNVIDYIIVHELCHTKVKNHSRLFWKEVIRVMPDYKCCERWLKDNKRIIQLI